jgi:RNA polymerase sigma-70 factor, ECF subfamily
MAHSDSQFEQLYRDYRSKISRYLTRLVDAAEAEDLTQIVFLKVGEGLAGFRGESSIATWIYRIATNVATDRLRSRAAQSAPLLPATPSLAERDDENDEPRSARDADAPSIESESIRLEMNDCIREFIDQLPSDYRATLVLSDIEGFTNREIADIVGASLETVKIRLHRARAELRNKLQGGCDLYHDAQNELACDRKPEEDSPDANSVSFSSPAPSTRGKGGGS